MVPARLAFITRLTVARGGDYGRIGSAGQVKTRQFAEETAATRDTEKLIREKTGKGYREVGG